MISLLEHFHNSVLSAGKLKSCILKVADYFCWWNSFEIISPKEINWHNSASARIIFLCSKILFELPIFVSSQPFELFRGFCINKWHFFRFLTFFNFAKILDYFPTFCFCFSWKVAIETPTEFSPQQNYFSIQSNISQNNSSLHRAHRLVLRHCWFSSQKNLAEIHSFR